MELVYLATASVPSETAVSIYREMMVDLLLLASAVMRSNRSLTKEFTTTIEWMSQKQD